MNNYLEVQGLRVSYERDIEILRGVDLVAKQASTTVIIGPNGAGKSTFLKGLAGVAPVTGGEIRLQGNRVEGLSSVQLVSKGIAFVPQESSVFGQMTVEENLRLGGWTLRSKPALVDQRVEICLQLFDSIKNFRERKAGDLSGGQQKLVEIARGLVSEPSLLLLDEPTAGLSPIMVREVYEQLAELRSKAPVTIVLVEQNVREALAVADHVYCLAMGMNDVDGSADEITGKLESIVRGWMSKTGARGSSK